MRNIFKAVKRIVLENEDVKVIYPIHMNPIVREIAGEILKDIDRVKLIEPLEVIDFHNFIGCFKLSFKRWQSRSTGILFNGYKTWQFHFLGLVNAVEIYCYGDTVRINTINSRYVCGVFDTKLFGKFRTYLRGIAVSCLFSANYKVIIADFSTPHLRT